MRGLQRALVALGAAGVLAGVVVALVIASSDHVEYRGLETVLALVIGYGFIGAGLTAWSQAPENNFGPLMTVTGFLFFLSELAASDNEVVFAVAGLLGNLFLAVVIHMLLAMPSGRLRSNFERWFVAGVYLFFSVPSRSFLLLDSSSCDGCPSNIVAPEQDVELAKDVDLAINLIVLAVFATVLVLLWRHWREGELAERHTVRPIFLTGTVILVVLFAGVLGEILGDAEFAKASFYATQAAILPLPYVFLFTLLRSIVGNAAVLAAENERLDAELRVRLEELRASRTRIVEAGYAERRRVERDLHDGAQQRLVSLALNLRMAQSKVKEDSDEAERLLSEASQELEQATAELRELARGIHPGVLTDRGLAAALEALASRAPLPVELAAAPDGRLTQATESAAYFVVAEALTNVARYAQADGAVVEAAVDDGNLVVKVSDDGVGGADPSDGSGLRGLADRVAALGGRLEVASEPGAGTTVSARIPVV